MTGQHVMMKEKSSSKIVFETSEERDQEDDPVIQLLEDQGEE